MMMVLELPGGSGYIPRLFLNGVGRPGVDSIW